MVNLLAKENKPYNFNNNYYNDHNIDNYEDSFINNNKSEEVMIIIMKIKIKII